MVEWYMVHIEWERHIDPNSGVAYYYHPTTQATQWDTPRGGSGDQQYGVALTTKNPAAIDAL